MGILLPLVAALVPLALAPGLLFYFDVTPKAVLLVAAAAICGAWLREVPWASRHGRIWTLLVAAQAVSLVVSTALSAHPAMSVSGSNWRRFGLLGQLGVLLVALAAAGYYRRRPERLPLLLRSVASAGALAALYSIAQYFGWDPLPAASAYHAGEGEFRIVRPPSTLGHASYAGAYLVFVVFFGVAVVRTETLRLWKALGYAAAVLASAAILLSGTRAALVGLAAGALYLAWRGGFRLTRTRIVAALVLAAALAGFYFSPAGARLRARVFWWFDEPAGGARLLLWRDSARMAGERWLTGFGPESFATEFPRRQSRELAQQFPDFYHESPHNVFLDALLSQGVPGLLVFAGLCALGFAAARACATPFADATAAGLAAALASLQFSVFVLPTALYFHLAVALMVSRIPEPPAPVARPRPWLRVPALALAAILAVFAARLLMADLLLARVDHRLKAGEVEEAIRTYQSARSWQPPGGGGSDLWYSRSLARFAQTSKNLLRGAHALQEGFQAAQHAAGSAEDRHNAWYNLAAYHALHNDFPATERSLRAAIDSAPRWFKPHWTLAQALQLAGRLPEAEREAALAAALNNGKNPEVARTWEEIRRAARDR